MPFSSPTTTRAVNEKRRPPLTTFATRLISTTRSWRSRPVALTVRSMVGAGMKFLVPLDGESALADALGEGLDAAVVLVAAAVEHRALDAGGLRALGEQLPGLGRLLARLERAQVGLGPVDGRQRAAGLVVDELGEDAAVGAEHRDARARRGPGDLGTDAAPAAEPHLRLGLDGHDVLPFRARCRACRPRSPRAFALSRVQWWGLTPSYQPSGPRTRSRSGCPCPCRAPAGASCGCSRRPRRRAACRCP